MRRNLNSKGFLLFEVIVSVAVIAAGMLFVIRPFVTAKASVERSRDLLVASILAENKMQDLISSGTIGEGIWQGIFAGSERYGWSVDSAKTKTKDLNEVTVKVYRRDMPGETECSLVTYINGNNDASKSA